MIVRWCAALAAASMCMAGSAAAGDASDTGGGTVAAASKNIRSNLAAADAGQVHDGTTTPAAEAEEPAIDFSVTYTAEVFRDTSGALRRGTRYLDNLDLILKVDAERALGVRGVTLFAYGLYNNGEPFSDDLVGATQGVSNIETGVRAARLYEAWIEQRFASDRASVKFGLYDLNSEFDAIEAASLFINPSHGIGPDFSQSGRNGPSIFPVTSLGLRGDYRLSDNWLVRAAILDAVPGNPDRPKRTVIKLSEGEGALGVAELNYLDDRTKAAIGYWRYTARFEPFSAQAVSGELAQRRGNDGLYAFVERRLITEEAGEGQGLAGWIRIGFADERLNPVGTYLGGGLTYTGPFTGRDEDQIGVAVGVAKFGRPFRRSAALAGDPSGAREAIVEVTYRAALNRWLTLQPDLQFVVNPGGRPQSRNALILGLRTEIGF